MKLQTEVTLKAIALIVLVSVLTLATMGLVLNGCYYILMDFGAAVGGHPR